MVNTLRRNLRGRLPVVSDATAALTALRANPGLPTRGVIVLCDFGGSGTSITLVNAARDFAPFGETVRLPLLEPFGSYGPGEQVLKLPTVTRQQMYERELVAFLGRNLRHERVLLVVTYRDDEPGQPRLGAFLAELDRGPVERLELSRLDRAETTAQLTGMSESAVKVGIHRGLKALAGKLGRAT